MRSYENIVEKARRLILDHKLRSGPALMEYFASRVALDPSLDPDGLQKEAVARGLYRYMGERYLLALKFALSCAEAGIKLDVIRSDEELARFLERASHAMAPFGHCGKVLADLKIEACQLGLHALLAQPR